MGRLKSTADTICAKHKVKYVRVTEERFRCLVCKREAAAEMRKRKGMTPRGEQPKKDKPIEQSVKAKRLAGMARALQRREDEALDARVERVWQERYAAEEIAYYREIRVVRARTVWA